MDHLDLHKIFQTLLPIGIFVFWAFISRPAKKRQKQQQEQERKRRLEQQRREEEANSRRDEVETNPQPQAEPSREGNPDKWKRTLEDILGDMGVPMEHEEPAPQPVETPRQEKTRTTPGSPSIEIRIPETVSIPIPERPAQTLATASVHENAYTQQYSPITSKAAYAIEPTLAAQSSQDNKRLFDLGAYSPAELQRLIVWSEVLGKPIALRDEQIP